MNKKLVYVAGALRSNIPEYIKNMHRMIKEADKVRRSGFAVIIPCEDLLRGLVCGDYDFEDYFENSYEMLTRCDAVYVIPGWEKSEGTKKEIKKAQSLNIPVYFELNNLITYEKAYETIG
jgi:hypothetical protein